MQSAMCIETMSDITLNQTNAEYLYGLLNPVLKSRLSRGMDSKSSLISTTKMQMSRPHSAMVSAKLS
jgi:hypothetical protein